MKKKSVQVLLLMLLICSLLVISLIYSNHHQKIDLYEIDEIETTKSNTEIYLEMKPRISSRNVPIVKESNGVVIDSYGPPLRNDGVFFPRDSADVRGTPVVCKATSRACIEGCSCMKQSEETQQNQIPINVQTRGAMMDFSQMGILTSTTNNKSNKSNDILPLMGRRLTLGSSDKWQYYTYANNGNTFVQTRLPIMVKGRDASGEYGCDRLYTDDVVYVEGYGEQFRVKIYENSLFTYIPVV